MSPHCKCAVQQNPPQSCTYPDCHEGKHDAAVRWSNRITLEQQAMLDARAVPAIVIGGNVAPSIKVGG